MRPLVLVEDHESISEVLAELLSMEGFSVVQTRTAEEARRALRALREPAVVLLDLVLPDEPGETVLEALTHGHAHAVIVISAASPARLEATRGHPRVRGVFAKPFPIDELLAAIRRSAND